jgi:hypothetical protein
MQHDVLSENTRHAARTPRHPEGTRRNLAVGHYLESRQ